LVRNIAAVLLTAVLLTGCASVGERPEERGISLVGFDGRTSLPGLTGTVRSMLGMGVDASGCLYREWGEGRVDGRVVLIAGECRAEVD
jgi:hypothetical protein